METLDNLKDKFAKEKSIIQRLRLELKEHEDKAINLLEKIYEMDDSMVKVVCFNCNGIGYYKVDDKNKVCDVCGGKKYLWMRYWKDESGT